MGVYRRLEGLARLLALVAAVACPGVLRGADDPRIDSDTGRDLAHWPPDRHFDHKHMRLELDIPDMDVPRLHARQTLTVAPVGRARDLLELDAGGMTVHGASLGGRPLCFSHGEGRLTIHLDRPIPPGQDADVTIEYTLDYPASGGIGLTWTPGRPDGADETARASQIHTQGQPEYNHLWFPCRDSPNERLTTELLVTVADGFEVCSNGRLLGMSAAADGRITWHWLQDKPIAAYLVVLVVGRFDVLDLGDAEVEDADGRRRLVPVRVYSPTGSSDRVRRSFARTPAMIEHFSRLFGEPYPWDKYDQLLVRNFRAGGMENASATTISAAYASMAENSDDLIVHELVHQWMGDLVGYKSWAHAWLGEGWATYGQALWAEAAAPPAGRRRAYQRQIAALLARQRGLNRASAPDYPALVSTYYTTPEAVFVKPDDIYAKGGLVLHMLRMRLGDEVFFSGVRLYIQRFKYQTAETDDFRRCMEEVSGQSLERFFDQWTARPGLPRLKIDIAWDEADNRLHVRAEQTQRIDRANPAYALEIPIVARFENGPSRAFILAMDTRSAEASFPLPEAPSEVLVDPAMTQAAPTQVSISLGPEPEPPGPPDVEEVPSEAGETR